jgi:hypothetical protein
MYNSYLNILTFLLTTLFYYIILKPTLPYSIYNNKQEYQNYVNNNYLYLAIYVLVVILIQFMVNSSIINSKCGENIWNAYTLTFLPWILIFGVLVVVLIIYPGFKSAFSDIIGYYYVSNSASKILTELLVNKDIEEKLIEEENMSPQKKAALASAADVIIKICGNTSILINQIAPNNFNEYWNILKPLMKNKYKIDSPETDKIKSDLFEIIVTRDNVGEAMWYIYTGLLIILIIQVKINIKDCTSNSKTITTNYKKIKKEHIMKERK